MCEKERLRKVVRSLGAGEIPYDIPMLGEIGFPYVIFELGDGYTHSLLKDMGKMDIIWWLSSLHQAAVGIRQPHKVDVAHQDMKPSNLI